MIQKRILFIIETLDGGGAEKVLSTLVQNMDRQKYDITVCSIFETGVYLDEVRENVKFFSLFKIYKKNSLKYVVQYLKIKLFYTLPIQKSSLLFMPHMDYDIVVAFIEGFVTKFVARMPCTCTKIAWVHTDLKSNPWPTALGVYRNLDEEKHDYQQYSKIIHVSEISKNNFVTLYGLSDKCMVLYNPVNFEDIQLKSRDNCLLIKKRNIRFISVGRLVPQKGFDILIEAFNKVVQKNNNVELIILGSGYLEETLKDKVTNLKLKEYVHFIPFQKNPYPYFLNSDIFVCSSVAEGFSLVMVEAMMLSLPIISMRAAGPKEILEDGKWGMVTSAEELHIEMLRLVNDKDLRKFYSQKSYERSRAFDINKTLTKINNLFDSL